MKSVVSLFLLLVVSASGLHAQAPVAAPPPKQQYAIVLKLVPRLLGDNAPWTADDERLVGEHFRRLQRLTTDGVVLFAGRTLNTDESQFGLIVVEVDTEAEAREVMDGDPAVRGGVMTARLFPYHLALKR
ncbi:MAG TPA: YciI family protein [Rhodothermales bacterium]|nr:YciI family protein [Rhodothermales bacterium]